MTFLSHIWHRRYDKDEEAAMAVDQNTKKDLTKSLFVNYFEFGNNHDG